MKRVAIFPVLVFLLLCPRIVSGQERELNERRVKNKQSTKPVFRKTVKKDVEKKSVSAGYSNIKSKSMAVKSLELESQSRNLRKETAGEVKYSSKGTISFWNCNLGKVPGTLSKSAVGSINDDSPYIKGILSRLDASREVLKLEKPSGELRLMSVRADQLNHRHVRFEQVYKGLKVWAKDIYVHIDEKNEIYCLNGIYERTPFGLETIPVLTSDNAHEAVRSKSQFQIRHIEKEKTELVIYPHHDKRVYLAYAVSVRPSLIEGWNYFIDARTGKYIDRIQTVIKD